MTIKLYDNDSYAVDFDAVVISCEQTGDMYKTELDRTLFFPEEGGQCCDKGKINGTDIVRVELDGDKVYHYSTSPFEAGERVHGSIDFALRFRNMQNHSGEHIICGIAHKLYGYENVGFHLGEDYVTMDLSGELTDEDIVRIERLANEAVIKNMPVTAVYPSEQELASMDFRAKGEIEGRVRVVTIGDVDSCACCAPHVRFTGEIGIIKILDAMRHRGGMRLSILCGFDALRDYNERQKQAVAISNMLSVKQNEIADGVRKLLDDMAEMRAALSDKNKQLATLTIKSVEQSDKNICVFCDGFTPDQLRMIANEIKDRTPAYVAVLSGSDTDGYKYVIATDAGDVSEFVKSANAVLSGRGGGKGTMASGTFGALRKDIEGFFESNIE